MTVGRLASGWGRGPVRHPSHLIGDNTGDMGLARLFSKPKQPTDQNRVIQALWQDGVISRTPLEISDSSGLSVERADEAVKILLAMGLVERDNQSFQYRLTERGQRIARRGG